jgi:hypothetical protein
MDRMPLRYILPAGFGRQKRRRYGSSPPGLAAFAMAPVGEPTLAAPMDAQCRPSAPDGVDLQEGVVHATRRTYVPTGLSDPGIVVRTGGWRTCVNTSLNRKLAGRIRPNAARVKCCDPTSTAG